MSESIIIQISYNSKKKFPACWQHLHSTEHPHEELSITWMWQFCGNAESSGQPW